MKVALILAASLLPWTLGCSDAKDESSTDTDAGSRKPNSADDDESSGKDKSVGDAGSDSPRSTADDHGSDSDADSGNDGSSGGKGNSDSDGSSGSDAGSDNSTPDDVPIDDAVTSEWMNVTSNLAGMQSECGNLTFVDGSPWEDRLFAGVALHGLWESRDGGESWTQLGQGASGDMVTHRPNALTFDPDEPSTFWLNGIYGDQGVYQSTDDGDTFQRTGSVKHNDFISIDFSDPERQTILAGGHETPRALWRTTDGGETWEAIGDRIPAEYGASAMPFIIDAETYLLGAQDYQGAGAVLRSTDAGESWTEVSDVSPYGRPIRDDSGTLWWGARNKTVLRSDDDGETWDTLAPNAGWVLQAPIVMLKEGRPAAATSEGVAVVDESGDWILLTPPFPFNPRYFSYAPGRDTFLISTFDCGNKVLDYAISKYDR